MESGYLTPIMHKETPIEYKKWATLTWVGSIKRCMHPYGYHIGITNTMVPSTTTG